MPYPAEAFQAVRIKPCQQRIELTVGVNHKCPNYDRSKGEQFVLNAQGFDPNEEDKVFDNSVMDKQTLTSTLAVDSTSRFAAGILLRRRKKREENEGPEEDEDNDDEDAPPELHLTPL